jgi:hypothetical protein
MGLPGVYFAYVSHSLGTYHDPHPHNSGISRVPCDYASAGAGIGESTSRATPSRTSGAALHISKRTSCFTASRRECAAHLYGARRGTRELVL